MFSGSIVALITPFSNGQIDEQALAALVNLHVEHGTHGIVPVGTTGEAPTLTEAEYRNVVEIVVRESGGRLPVIAGAGSYSTASAIALTEIAAEAGADATLHVAGYYNRPNQEGLYQHFAAVAKAVDLPLLVYNIPARAVVNIEPETLARIAELPNVAGVKDSTADLARPARDRARLGEDFCLLSGEDATAVAFHAAGGNGCISVTANVAPALCARMQNACIDNDFVVAREIQSRLLPLHDALFVEPSPAGVKYACSLLNRCTPQCRLPIVPLEPDTRREIERAMEALNLL